MDKFPGRGHVPSLKARRRHNERRKRRRNTGRERRERAVQTAVTVVVTLTVSHHQIAVTQTAVTLTAVSHPGTEKAKSKKKRQKKEKSKKKRRKRLANSEMTCHWITNCNKIYYWCVIFDRIMNVASRCADILFSLSFVFFTKYVWCNNAIKEQF